MLRDTCLSFLAVLVVLTGHGTLGFSPIALMRLRPSHPIDSTSRARSFPLTANSNNSSNNSKRSKKPNSNLKPKGAPAEDSGGPVGERPNWIEPTDESVANSNNKYDICLQGSSFQVGPLTARIYTALTDRVKLTGDADAAFYRAIAMEMAAHQAVAVALRQQGLELISANTKQEETAIIYDSIESIRLQLSNLTPYEKTVNPPTCTSWADASVAYLVGDSFDFTMRGVAAEQRRLTTQDLLQSLDPDGSFAEQAAQAGIQVPTDTDELKVIADDFDDAQEDGDWAESQAQSLAEMTKENVRRTEAVPVSAATLEQAFAGTPARGYRVLSAAALSSTPLMQDEKKFAPTAMHVMDALVSHGCVLVDVTNGGVHMDQAVVLANMWQATEAFFATDDSSSSMEQGMVTAAETGSTHAKVGYASYDSGNMQFLETRLDRSSGALVPEEARSVLGAASCEALKKAFALVAGVSKDVVRLTVAASSVEAGALSGDAASEAARLLASELMDDGQALSSGTTIEHAESSVSMSPHRLCRYSNDNESEKKSKAKHPTREVFGAHTDSTFITAVPVAAVSGLEVYDEDQEQWYRPEKAARKQWQEEQTSAGKDPEAWTETSSDGVEVPWHARFVVLMPGELLQLVTRNEVPAAVHRVVATEGKASRLSAPILLRGRSGTKLDIARYMGSTQGDMLLEECSGMTIEQIHDAQQPTFQ